MKTHTYANIRLPPSQAEVHASTGNRHVKAPLSWIVPRPRPERVARHALAMPSHNSEVSHRGSRALTAGVNGTTPGIVLSFLAEGPI